MWNLKKRRRVRGKGSRNFFQKVAHQLQRQTKPRACSNSRTCLVRCEPSTPENSQAVAVVRSTRLDGTQAGDGDTTAIVKGNFPHTLELENILRVVLFSSKWDLYEGFQAAGGLRREKSRSSWLEIADFNIACMLLPRRGGTRMKTTGARGRWKF